MRIINIKYKINKISLEKNHNDKNVQPNIRGVDYPLECVRGIIFLPKRLKVVIRRVFGAISLKIYVEYLYNNICVQIIILLYVSIEIYTACVHCPVSRQNVPWPHRESPHPEYRSSQVDLDRIVYRITN